MPVDCQLDFIFLMESRSTQHGLVSDFCLIGFNHFHPTAGIPHDGTTNKSTITIELWITVVMYILSTCGLVLSIGCSIFVVVFRNNK